MSYHKWWSLLIIDDSAMIQGSWIAIGLIVGIFSSIWVASRIRSWEKRTWREDLK